MKLTAHFARSGIVGLMFLVLGGEALAQSSVDPAEVAKKAQNPISAMTSVPIQNNWDFGIGPAGAMRYTNNIQPVIPFSLNGDLNLITRTIMPVIHAESPLMGGGSVSGLGDITQSFFVSPKQTIAGWIVGGGPAFLYPSATDSALGAGKWGAGPTIVVLQQVSGWTYGVLTNYIKSFAGWKDEAVSASFIQPFLSYTFASHTTLSLNSESTYDWEHKDWSVPLNVMASQLVTVAGQMVQFQIGGRYYADSPAGGPDWGLRFTITLLFPD
jgi:hypothetical protein